MPAPAIVELGLDARRGRRELQVGDRVYLEDDPRKDLGTIERDLGGHRYFVKWNRSGKTWIYASAHLVLITLADS